MVYGKDLRDIVELVERCAYHSQLTESKVISGIAVQVPIWGNRETIIKIEREVIAEEHQSNEFAGATEVLSSELKYILESATEVSEPVYGKDDLTGLEQSIGRSVHLLDRSRMGWPVIEEKEGTPFLNCVKEETNASIRRDHQ